MNDNKHFENAYSINIVVAAETGASAVVISFADRTPYSELHTNQIIEQSTLENLMYLPQLSLMEHHAIQEIMTTEQSLNYPLDILDKNWFCKGGSIVKSLFKVLLLVSFLVFANVGNAQPTVGVIFDGPTVFSNDEAKMPELDKKLAELLPAEKCMLLPSKVMTEKSIAYRTANNMMLESEPDMDKPLSNELLSSLGKTDGCDYVLLFTMKRLGKKAGATGSFTGFSDSKALVVLTLTDIQVVDTNSGKFEYKKEYLSAGRDAVTRIMGIGGKPKEEKAMNDLFETFIKYLSIKPTAIP